MNRLRPLAAVGVLAAALAAFATDARLAADEPPADLVVLNARIYTASVRGERASAMAIRDGAIVAIGSERRVRPHVGPDTEVLDLWGHTVLPGFVDAHGHVLSLGLRLARVDVTGTGSEREVVEAVRARAAATPAGEWVLGRGWDQNDWADPRLPDHHDLSAAVPDHPVLLTRIDGHAALANRAALDHAGITRDTPDPPGGEILRDAAGEPTGVLVDGAVELVRSHVPPLTHEQRVERLRAALSECARHGLTLVHDAGIDAATEAAYRTLLERGEMPIRVHALASARGDLLAGALARGPERGERFTLGGIKVVLDGALGSRGALLSAPYADRPGHHGLLTFPYDSLVEIGEMALRRGLQLRVHAIGDSANTLALDAFEAVGGGRDLRDARWAIEHAQIVRPRDIERFEELGIVASVQGMHCTSDAPWVEARIGTERSAWCYPWRSLLDRRVRLANGSDFPVESVNPLLGIHASLTRRDTAGALPAAGWFPAQRMNRDEALLSFTRWGAHLAFRDRDLGSLERGRRADFVVLDRDIVTCRYSDIPRTRVLRTFVDGRAVHALPLFADEAAAGRRR